MIEDSIDGIASAKAAGLPTVAVAHSYALAELEKTKADLILPRLADISEQNLHDLYQKIYG